LALVGETLKDSQVLLGAQNLYPEKEGAFTGEIRPTMLLDVGCKYVNRGEINMTPIATSGSRGTSID
jgi:triosephosphate isomerase